MSQIAAVLRSRKTTIPVACIAGTLALAAGLFGTGMVDSRQAAVLVFALYIASKFFMAGVALWVAARHSPKFRGFLQRCIGR